MTYYLYKKTHLITGLKYLGQTQKDDPHAYRGSGRYWTTHLNENGITYSTEILQVCESLGELKKWGLYYSELWNVAESEDWANLMPEAGGAGRHCIESCRKMSAARTGKKQSIDTVNKRISHLIGVPSKLKGTHTQTIASKKKISESSSAVWNNFTAEERAEQIRKMHPIESYTEGRKLNMSLGMRGKKKTKTAALLASEEQRRNRTPAQKLKCGVYNRGKTWKIVDGKRVWFIKGY